MHLQEKLNIAFWIWAPFDTGEGFAYHDFVKELTEARERGFNCVRVEDGAGFFRTPEGEKRGDSTLHPVFGKYTKYIRQNLVLEPTDYNPKERLLALFRAAESCDMYVILSSWYYLHTNWYMGDDRNDPLFALPTEEKLAYFARELNEILSILRENGLIRRVAFAELFNEFDGIPFLCGERGDAENETYIRTLHEKTIDWLRERNPDVRFGYDMCTDWYAIIPRNVDVINRHNYYMWDLYRCFEEGKVLSDVTEMTLSDAQKQYLIDPPVTVAEVNEARRQNLRTGRDWSRRVALYASLDRAKLPALEKLLKKELEARQEEFLDILRRSMTELRDYRDKYLPEADMVMGEGVTYCASNDLLFEEHSDLYWEVVEKGLAILRELGFMGAVVRTTSGPEDPSWYTLPERYVHANAIL